MVEVLYTHFDTQIPDGLWNFYAKKLPLSIMEKLSRFRRWQDRQAGLFGKLLLMEGLTRYGYDNDCLNNVLLDQYGRPFIDNRVDFNISHSEGYVVCSLIEGGRVGIDIERIKSVDLSDFENVMTHDEIRAIKESDGYKKFYEYWTIKESVLKASGKGLTIPFRDVVIDGKRATLYNQYWFLTSIDIDTRYVCHLATDRKHTETRLDEIIF